ncbi:hypothetical protein [Jannaschia sp. R86511]|uniref:hypothetical protein n=1 Tax=Jannaschia sp. R86511 TaxID=3093853 RepID=UPI0036D25924
MLTRLATASNDMLLPASYDLLWSLALVVMVLSPVVLALIGYGVVRLAVRHELARRDRSRARTSLSVHD